MPPLSIFLITLNEADRLGRALDAVRDLTDDLVVLDSGSADATREVAAERGARVEVRAFDGYGPQKRAAEDLCRHPWLLNLDADEVATPALAAEIRALFAGPGPALDAYEVPIVETFPGEAAPGPHAYALHPVRLYRREAGRYAPSPVHDRVALREGARVGRLAGALHHFSVRSLGDQLTKLNAYTDAQADDLDARGKHLSPLRLAVEFPAAFLKAYVLRRHVLRGTAGFMTAMNFAFYRWLRIAKHVERRLARKGRLVRKGRAVRDNAQP